MGILLSFLARLGVAVFCLCACIATIYSLRYITDISFVVFGLTLTLKAYTLIFAAVVTAFLALMVSFFSLLDCFFVLTCDRHHVVHRSGRGG